jgi:hypothetical protein
MSRRWIAVVVVVLALSALGLVYWPFEYDKRPPTRMPESFIREIEAQDGRITTLWVRGDWLMWIEAGKSRNPSAVAPTFPLTIYRRRTSGGAIEKVAVGAGTRGRPRDYAMGRDGVLWWKQFGLAPSEVSWPGTERMEMSLGEEVVLVDGDLVFSSQPIIAKDRHTGGDLVVRRRTADGSFKDEQRLPVWRSAVTRPSNEIGNCFVNGSQVLVAHWIGVNCNAVVWDLATEREVTRFPGRPVGIDGTYAYAVPVTRDEPIIRHRLDGKAPSETWQPPHSITQLLDFQPPRLICDVSAKSHRSIVLLDWGLQTDQALYVTGAQPQYRHARVNGPFGGGIDGTSTHSIEADAESGSLYVADGRAIFRVPPGGTERPMNKPVRWVPVDASAASQPIPP